MLNHFIQISFHFIQISFLIFFPINIFIIQLKK